MINKPIFNNKPNEHIIYHYDNGTGVKVHQDYWISRAPAVVGIVFAFFVEGGTRVLIIKRSNNMVDESNKFGAPSGYLDWNETGYEGIIREIYEETSFYIPDYNKFMIFNNNKQPFYINDDPKKDAHQNISLIYLLSFDFSTDPTIFPIDIEKYTDHETAEVKWLKLSDFYNENREWAFHHDEIITKAHKYFENR